MSVYFYDWAGFMIVFSVIVDEVLEAVETHFGFAITWSPPGARPVSSISRDLIKGVFLHNQNCSLTPAGWDERIFHTCKNHATNNRKGSTTLYHDVFIFLNNLLHQILLRERKQKVNVSMTYLMLLFFFTFLLVPALPAL